MPCFPQVICSAGLSLWVVWDLVAHDGEDDVAELPRDGGDSDAMALALGTLLVIEGLEVRGRIAWLGLPRATSTS